MICDRKRAPSRADRISSIRREAIAIHNTSQCMGFLVGCMGEGRVRESNWKQSDRKQRILTFCNTKPPDGDVETCYTYLRLWLMDKQTKYFDSDMEPRDPTLEGQDFEDLIQARPPS